MSLIQEHENEFRDLSKSILKRCENIPDLKGDLKTAEQNTTQNEIDDAAEIVEQMEMEIINLPSSERQSVKARVAGYKKDIKDMEKRLRRAMAALSNSQSARDELFDFDDGDDAREALIDNTQRLDRTSRRLDNGHRAALEAVDVGAGAISELHRQRETIERSRGRLRGMDGDLSASSKLLRGIYNRAIRNRVMTALITGGLILTIIVIAILVATK
eukprot:m.194678 g.194678  ORF g.194678 m.194678 type:complete len:216 (+) comp18657_c0_seq4:159-806(+)